MLDYTLIFIGCILLEEALKSGTINLLGLFLICCGFIRAIHTRGNK